MINSLPLRQKILIITAITGGLFIWMASSTELFSSNAINELIFFYSLGLPLLIQSSPAIIDLNNNKIFITWLSLSTVLFLVALSTTGSNKFLIDRSIQFDRRSPINSLMSNHSTAALKALFVFLILYWLLNQLSKKLTGNFIVNTFLQRTWVNEYTKRKMTAMDVACNMVLFVAIIWAVLF